MKIILSTLNSKYIHSNLALRYLEKSLIRAGFNPLLLEFSINDRLESISVQLLTEKADIYCFSCYIWNITMTLQICSILKKINKSCKIILGGPEVSFNFEQLLQNHKYADFVIIGEGEVTICELICKLKNNGDYGSVKGIAYRENDKIILSQNRLQIMSLDDLPSPYTKNDIDELSGKIIYYETSRGCPFSCSYCISSTTKGVRYFSLDRVKSDLELIFDRKVPLVKFVDRTFNSNPSRALEILKFCLENHNITKLHFEIYAELLDDKTINFLETMPPDVFQFEIGIQSTNTDTLCSIGRSTGIDYAFANIKRLIKSNIPIHLDIIAGLPDEDMASFKNSFDAVYSLSPNRLQLGFLKLLPGTEIRAEAQKYSYEYLDFPPYEVLSNNSMSYYDVIQLKNIEFLLDRYYNSHYFEKSISFATSKFSSPFDFYMKCSNYFLGNNLYLKSNSLVQMFEYFAEFYKLALKEDYEKFIEYLKFDYIFCCRSEKLPKWANEIKIENFKAKCFEFLKNQNNVTEFLPHYVNLSPKNIYKNVDFHIFNFDGLKILLFDRRFKNVHNISQKFV